MDQESAKALFAEGAFLIIADMPLHTEFGIDWNSWTIGPKFQGVKMIPPGVHFVFYSAKNKFSDTSPRTGMFLNFERRQILTKKWDPNLEILIDDPKSDEEVEQLRSNLRNLDSNLGAYPYETLKKWLSLTDKITTQLLSRLNPQNGVISSVPELIAESNENTERDGKYERSTCTDKDGLPLMKTKTGTAIQFTNIPKKWFPENSSPSQISKYSLDSSFVLGMILKEYPSGCNILAELQYAFVCFVLGQVYDAFEQWKKLVHVLCFCEEDLLNHEQLYVDLLTILYYQILEIPEDFFVDIVSSNNFLVSTLNILFNNISCSTLSESSKQRSYKFRKYLTKKFKWNFKRDPEDWAPVVVET